MILMNRKFKRTAFKIQIFHKILNAFLVIFDHFNTFLLYKSLFLILLTPKVWKGVCVSYFHEDPPGKPGQNSERVSLLIDDFSETLGHILTEILSQRKRFHPFGMVVSQGHDVRVLVYCRRERASNIQPKPFPPLFNLRERQCNS